MSAMESNIYAVIDTNVIVSALISKSLDSNPVKVVQAITQDRIIPIYNDEILQEYKEVLSRPKFHLDETLIMMFLRAIVMDGLWLDRTKAGEEYFPDPKDVVFYEIAMSKEGSYLVTGNIKHFPAKPFVVTPAEMIGILEQKFPSYSTSQGE
jgi:uncharacterized protein